MRLPNPAVLALPLLWTFLSVASLRAQRPAAAQVASRADAYMRAAVQHDQFSGSVLIARDGTPVFSKGYGMASYELQVPNTPETVFRIASVTKQFTAMAILQLQEEKKLSVQDPICTYLADCPEAWRPITIHHLLTHTSGIFNASRLPDWDERIAVQPHTRLGFVDVFRDLPLEFPPGTRHRYSNSGYYLLGLIIERASGITWEDFIRQRIFQPLGMTRSYLNGSRELIPNRAQGYYSSLDRFINAPYLNPMLGYASGAILSTTGDLLIWDQALYTERLVSRASLEAMVTPALDNYAYGWVVGRRFEREVQGHAGSDNGFSSYLMRVPSERLTVIVLSNSDRTSATKVAVHLTGIALGKEVTLPTAQLYDLLAATAVRQGGDSAVRQFHALRRADSTRYRYDEELLNDLGYDLLGNRRAPDAVAIFRLNTELFPESANAFDSLGEGYAALGDTTRAIANYERALAIDPALPSAQRMLRSLRGEP